MPEAPARRGRGRPKGTPASEKQKATSVGARKRAAEEKRKRKAERAELEKPRWKQLEDGDITLKDLTDEELIRGECANNDGTWEGRRHKFEPRLINRMRTEYKRRFSKGIEMLGPLVLETMEDILYDDEARAQQVAVVKMVTEYTIGKVPDVVHVGGETEYDRLQQSAFVVLRGADNVVDEDDDADIHDAEIVEEEQ